MTLSAKLKVWPLGKLQDLLTMLTEIEAAGYTVDDVTEYVEKKRSAIASKNKARGVVLGKKCPACEHVMSMAPVNTGPGDRTGDNSTFVWACPACGEEVWTDKPLRKIVAELSAGKAAGDTK